MTYIGGRRQPRRGRFPDSYFTSRSENGYR